MAQLVYMRDPKTFSDEGVVIDTADMSDKELNDEYAPLEVQFKVILEDECSGMPTDRLLVAG